MALMKQVPNVPSSRGINENARQEFTALKSSLSGIASWEMSPNDWDAIQIAYPFTAKENQARVFLAAIQLPTPDM
ncbi:MAG: hypothetical protein NTX79_03400 [Candidatus Micrarchaeota archaeon]|nr:hypothetical protein [Candidatus Micrarchaeota archaeon]